MISTVQLYGE